ncbi:MAG TPA: enoyl-CoA hydratase/isomerase family protein [Dehalococcoidia bacterium]|nr:enoyl-CoA hydratase/isomerase family protein [Dehalococcoidia bacterium]
MTFEALILDRYGAIATIRLNRPDKHNAINSVMSREMIEVLDALEADDDVRVIILTGAGDKAFCAGADMAEAVQARSDGRDGKDFAARAAIRLSRVSKPLIAAVNGYAYGGGAVFAIACDIRIASDNARFRFVGASYGLSVGASQLPRLVGAPMAKELIFTARTVDADEAVRIGLVNHVVEQAELAHFVMEMAGQIAQNSAAAILASKEVIDIATANKNAAKREMEHNIELRQSDEHRSRFKAAADRVTGGQ